MILASRGLSMDQTHGNYIINTCTDSALNACHPPDFLQSHMETQAFLASFYKDAEFQRGNLLKLKGEC